ncbi:hypothetical protein [Flavitalea sp.]|nr:hypothetical protein [Flavitalea sp.]
MFVFTAVLLFTILAVLWLRRAMPKDQYGLTDFQIVLAFGFKVLMGCAYGYIFLVKYDGDDTWWLHEYSLGQTDLLKEDPWWFFAEMNPLIAFTREDASAGYYYLADLETWLLTKPFAFVNFLSGGNYYINIVFFNIPVFLGQYWLFRLLRKKFASPGWPVYAVVFLVPPVVFWLSGLRADGILFFMVMLAFREFSKLIERPAVRPVIIYILALACILILRSIVLMLLVPAFVSWFITRKTGKPPVPVFIAVYSTCIILVLGSILVSPERNAATVIVNHQRSFFELEGNTRFHLDSLEPEALSFVRILPQALNNTFLRPYPWEAKGALQYASVLEVLLFLFLVFLLSLRPIPGWKGVINHPFTLSFLCFAASLYVITGYIVPFPGAIVRYKIIGELFMMSIMTCCINWNRQRPDAL